MWRRTKKAHWKPALNRLSFSLRRRKKASNKSLCLLSALPPAQNSLRNESRPRSYGHINCSNFAFSGGSDKECVCYVRARTWRFNDVAVDWFVYVVSGRQKGTHLGLAGKPRLSKLCSGSRRVLGCNYVVLDLFVYRLLKRLVGWFKLSHVSRTSVDMYIYKAIFFKWLLKQKFNRPTIISVSIAKIVRTSGLR